MDPAIIVEERSWREIVPAGVTGGLVAGVALGVVQFLIAAARKEGALLPFRLVASLALGTRAFDPTASTALVMLVGVLLHLALAALFGVVFGTLLAFAFQLSARRWLMVLFGLLYGFLLWEINFLAILPLLYPDLVERIEFSSQIWKGIVAYTLVYGPVLALYFAATRPGVRADWRA